MGNINRKKIINGRWTSSKVATIEYMNISCTSPICLPCSLQSCFKDISPFILGKVVGLSFPEAPNPQTWCSKSKQGRCLFSESSLLWCFLFLFCSYWCTQIYTPHRQLLNFAFFFLWRLSFIIKVKKKILTRIQREGAKPN